MNETKKYFKPPEKTAMQWFVVHVKWRKEPLFAEVAEKEGIETFIAKVMELSTNKRGEKQRVERMVIPEIVFVHTSYEKIEVLMGKAEHEHGMKVYYARNIRDGYRRIMTVPEHEMRAFIKIASKSNEKICYLKPDEVSLAEGDKVKIHGGIFDGATGTLLNVKGKKGKRVVVSLDGLAVVATAYITPEYIEVLSSANSVCDLTIEEIEDLQESSEALLKEKLAKGPNREARLKGLSIMAERVMKATVRRSMPSRDLALLTYAVATGDQKLRDSLEPTCQQHVKSMKESQTKSKMEEMLKAEMSEA